MVYKYKIEFREKGFADAPMSERGLEEALGCFAEHRDQQLIEYLADVRPALADLKAKYDDIDKSYAQQLEVIEKRDYGETDFRAFEVNSLEGQIETQKQNIWKEISPSAKDINGFVKAVEEGFTEHLAKTDNPDSRRLISDMRWEMVKEKKSLIERFGCTERSEKEVRDMDGSHPVGQSAAPVSDNVIKKAGQTLRGAGVAVDPSATTGCSSVFKGIKKALGIGRGSGR